MAAGRKRRGPGWCSCGCRQSSRCGKARNTQSATCCPPKGSGLSQASPRVLAVLGAGDWPEALTTNDALFGSGITNLLIGAADVRTMFSNYVTDMASYYEHGYHHVFPSLHGLLHDGLTDARTRRTPGGQQRRAVHPVQDSARGSAQGAPDGSCRADGPPHRPGHLRVCLVKGIV
ncbi:hypothetical protein ZWY2020_017824 [Hordeum vulgare]|nr:hypothetical protein ZWY2020_017824 [Hordeum vulgare]